ncbi:MAG: GGDEF domain-containing protein [Erysipelotrichaceae bacterium]|nr:GGDEF domain-containing protein [Erysipelotrichaceae bacterium]
MIPIRINNLVQTRIIKELSFHDDMTGLLNRRAYEEELNTIREHKDMDDLVIVAMDVNGLKKINDTIGHECGDELIIGAASCMKKCFDKYGKVFRTGGDEFCAILRIKESQLTELQYEFQKVVSTFESTHIKNLSISCGYVVKEKDNNMSIHDMIVLADKRMYADKKNYYNNNQQ